MDHFFDFNKSVLRYRRHDVSENYYLTTNIIRGNQSMSSLRLAILQSIEESTVDSASAQQSTVDGNNVSKKTKPKRRTRPKKDFPIVKLPQIDKYIRNDDPTLIDTYGFVEVSNVLSNNLIEQIRMEAASKIDAWQGGQELMGGDSSSKNNKRKTSEVVEVEEISNALQMVSMHII